PSPGDDAGGPGSEEDSDRNGGPGEEGRREIDLPHHGDRVRDADDDDREREEGEGEIAETRPHERARERRAIRSAGLEHRLDDACREESEAAEMDAIGGRDEREPKGGEAVGLSRIAAPGIDRDRLAPEDEERELEREKKEEAERERRESALPRESRGRRWPRSPPSPRERGGGGEKRRGVSQDESDEKKVGRRPGPRGERHPAAGEREDGAGGDGRRRGRHEHRRDREGSAEENEPGRERCQPKEEPRARTRRRATDGCLNLGAPRVRQGEREGGKRGHDGEIEKKGPMHPGDSNVELGREEAFLRNRALRAKEHRERGPGGREDTCDRDHAPGDGPRLSR